MFKYRVESPNIYSIGYDSETKLLEIDYNSGRICRYQNVPLIDYQRLSAARNKENYVDRYIRDSYIQIAEG
ncbi:TPA: KTSC domain-containing protein [Providencia rettgeri]